MQNNPVSPLLDPEATAIERAVYFCGGARKVADALEVSAHSIYRWIYRGRCPAEAVIPLEKLSAGFVSRHELRPDIYPVVQEIT